MRRDAELNRQRVLEAAARLFADKGTDIGFDEIARAAGVGVGTVYRRFPDRVTLIAALVETRYDAILGRLERCLDREDAHRLLEDFFILFTQESTRDAGFRDATFEQPDVDPLEGFHERIAALFDRAIERAREVNALRDDVTPTDLAALTVLLSHLRGAGSEHLIPRYVTVTLEGLRPNPERPTLPGTAPTNEQLLTLVANSL